MMPDMENDKSPMIGTNEQQVSSQQKISGMEVPVPIDALAMPGEDDKLNNPSVGDPVMMQAEGKVSRIEGNTAFVMVKTVNGKPVNAEAAKTANTPQGMDEDGSNEFEQLKADASNLPQGY